MAEQSFFWNGTTVGDAVLAPYDEDKFSLALRVLCGSSSAPNQSGVFNVAGSNLGPSIGVNAFGVFPGRSLVFGTLYVNTPPGVSFTIPSANSTTRRDRIAVRKDWAAKTVRIVRIPGTEGVGPGAYVQTEGVLWDMPLYNIDVNTAGVITIASDDRVYLPFVSDLPSSLTTLPFVTSIPNLDLSVATENLITTLNNLANAPSIVTLPALNSAPILNLSAFTLGLITSLPNLNYPGLTGLVPPMCSLTHGGIPATIPPTDNTDLAIWDVRRLDTTGTMWSSGAPARITVPLTGLYEVSASRGMAQHATVDIDFHVYVRKNSVPGSPGIIANSRITIPSQAHLPGVGGYWWNVLTPTVINLNSGDFVELLSDHLGVTSPSWAGPTENNFMVKYVGARTPAVIGTII